MIRLSTELEIGFKSPAGYKEDLLYIVGLNSGTSADGLDAALVEFKKGSRPKILLCKTYRYSKRLKESIIAGGEADFNNGIEWLKIDAELGEVMGRYARRFVSMVGSAGHRCDLVASHGQTVRHIPSGSKYHLSLQIGDPSRIAKITGFPMIADFRRSDLAVGGRGAPLSPILHERLFRARKEWRAIVNIGGIANITVLPPSGAVKGPFAADCGPGNMPIDLAMQILFSRPYDKYGKIAGSGKVLSSLVSRTMRNRYFESTPPKSTGREQFGLKFVENILRKSGNASPADIVSTLTEITVRGITDFLKRFAGGVRSIYLCGGGARNKQIVVRLEELIPNANVHTTAALGHDPDYLEALLWAYLAYCFVNNKRINARRFTGARSSYIPGRLCLP